MRQSLLFLVLAAIWVTPVQAQRTKKTTSPANANAPASPTAATPDYNTVFQPMKWRSIGPFRGGRSVAVSGVTGNIGTYYMGTTGGGVWKTDDLGNTWHNISDGFFTTGSVGAIAVSESDPNVVFVGMGEHAPRGVMTHHGDGVYKSTDAGKTWKKMGLEKTQHISRIAIHPRDPDIVYVSAQGPLYSSSPERGIYKSTDGGKSWKQVLFVDDKTGGVELSMDRNNPRILYAAMWEHGRLPWKVISGGSGSGLYKSVDSGETWQKIHNGLPAELGKMAISVSRANSNKVYALIESDSDKEQGGLFVSENGGQNWNRISDDHRLVQRAWYYIEVYADPKNENTVYVLSAPALRSTDGGKTWENLDGPHGDYHDLWINPFNPTNIAIADDGGVGISLNSGNTWSSQANMPTAQLYRINVDNAYPYRIYAGQQDNSSLFIASQELGSSGITEASWGPSAGGESAFLAFDPDNPRYVMGGSYLGTIEILDNQAKASTNIMAAPIQYLAREASDMKYRFNWNAPIIWSKHEPGTYYHAAQVVLRTRDMGQTWEEVSPDLTRNEKEKQGKGGGPYTNEAVGAENYGTISYLMESPHEKGTIWVGSDDGLVHLTRDGGKTWQNVTPIGLGECLVNAIEVSPHDPATVYIATTRYKFNDHTPALYKSTNYGKTWANISTGIPYGAFTRVVREDQVRRDLLFAGTETGVYMSWDGGKNWSIFQLNLPVTPITDLRVHQGNLIAATSGRSFWILDDLSLLRQYQHDSTRLILFQPSTTLLGNTRSELDRNNPGFSGAHPTRGVNPASGAVFYYYVPDSLANQELVLEIKDGAGNLVRSFSSSKDRSFQSYAGGPPANPTLSNRKGLNRFVWDLRYPTMPGVPGVYIESSYRGHKASPGTYTLTLSTAKNTSTQSAITILPNPLYPGGAETYREYHTFMVTAEGKLAMMHQTVNTLYQKQQQLVQVLDALAGKEALTSLHEEGKALLDRMKAWDARMVQRKSKAYDDVENFPNGFTANYLFMINHCESDIPRVTKPNVVRRQELESEWSALETEVKQLLDKNIPEFNKRLWEAGYGALWKN